MPPPIIAPGRVQLRVGPTVGQEYGVHQQWDLWRALEHAGASWTSHKTRNHSLSVGIWKDELNSVDCSHNWHFSGSTLPSNPCSQFPMTCSYLFPGAKFGASVLIQSWAVAAKERRGRKEHLQGIANVGDTDLSETQRENWPLCYCRQPLGWFIVQYCGLSFCCQRRKRVCRANKEMKYVTMWFMRTCPCP